MTVSYNDQFFKLLFRWKASVWKGILPSLAVYMTIFYLIYLPLFFILNDDHKIKLRTVQKYCEANLNHFPITFLLGFYVSFCVKRWWEQFLLIVSPNTFMYKLAGYVPDNDAETVKIRRNIARWINLMCVLYYREFSSRVLKRFPMIDSMVQTGLMTQSEKDAYDLVPAPFGKAGLPLIWIQKALNILLERGQLNNRQHNRLYEEAGTYRSNAAALCMYDRCSVPLAYTQVVTMATWSYFMIAMIANMNMHINEDERDLMVHDVHVPIFLIFQFVFYMGWLRVAQAIFRPFGEDDDDFEMNYLIDKTVSVGDQIGTVMCDSWPGFSEEWHVNAASRVPLPYTKEALKRPGHIYKGNLEHIYVKEKNRTLLSLSQTEEQLNACYRNTNKRVEQLQQISFLRRNGSKSTDQQQQTSELMMAKENSNQNSIE